MDYGRPSTPAEPYDPAVSVHDRGWIPAPPEDVYGIAESIHTYPSWWPSIQVEERESGRFVQLAFPGLGRTRASVAGQRPHVGLMILLSCDVYGVL